MNGWNLILEEYLSLHWLLHMHTFSEARRVLMQLSLEEPYLPKVSKVTIHILEILEVDIPFNKLWVCGMHQAAWPPEPSPNPFIPIKLQCKYGMPKSSAQRVLLYAQRLTKILFRGGRDQVIFSYPKLIENNSTDISPLLKGIRSTIISEVLDIFKYNFEFSPVKLEDIQDSEFILSKEKDVILGGSRTLTLQSICPFWAFAEVRLGAKLITRPVLGLTPAEKGELLHGVLENVWKTLQSYDQLMKLSDLEISHILKKYIKNELYSIKKRKLKNLTENYSEIEKERMHHLLMRWMSFERERDYFNIYQLEERRVLYLGNLEIRLRLDRIDQLKTGEFIIIDYKTSKSEISTWFGDPLQDVQLPLYCLMTAPVIDCVAFAIIRPDVLKFRGISHKRTLLPGIGHFDKIKHNYKLNDWHAQIEAWRLQLEKVAMQFYTGVASVAPLKNGTTCLYCHLEIFCRIYEQGFL